MATFHVLDLPFYPFPNSGSTKWSEWLTVEWSATFGSDATRLYALSSCVCLKECGSISLLYNLHVSQCWCVRHVQIPTLLMWWTILCGTVVCFINTWYSIYLYLPWVYELSSICTTTPGPIGVCTSLVVHTHLYTSVAVPSFASDTG